MINTQPYQALAPYYDMLMDHVDYEEWLEELLDFFPAKAKPTRVLDLSCGTGAFALRMARMGMEVWAMDLSAAMVEQARKKAAAEGLDIHFSVGDMRHADLGQHFDVVLNIHDGFNYLQSPEDVDAFFACADRHLDRGGLLLCDVATPDLCRRYFFHYFEVTPLENGELHRESHFDEESQCVNTRISLQLDGANAVEETHLQKAYPLEAVKAYCEAANWTSSQIVDQDSLETADESAERLLMVMHK